MASPSPVCTVQTPGDYAGVAQATTNGVDVTAGQVVTIALVSPAGVNSWGLTLYGQDDVISPPVVTVNNAAKTATFTAPALPWSLIYKSTVNGGVDVNGVTQSSYSTTFKISCKTAAGNRLAASNETLENNATLGWTGIVNGIVRTPANAAPTGTGIPHIVGGVQNAAASTIVDADVDAAAAIAASKVVQATGTGIPHVVSGALSAASSLIVNADVNAAAAIAGSKISPLFGTQAIQGASLDTSAAAVLALGGTNATGISAGTGNVAASGVMRFAGGVTKQIVSRNNSNTADIPIISTNGADIIQVGDTVNTVYVNVESSNGVNLSGNLCSLQSAAFAYRLLTDSVAVKAALPYAGCDASSKPFMLLSATYAIAGAAITLTAAQYQCCIQIATGTPSADRTVIAPNTVNGTFLFVNQTDNAQTFKTAAGTGIAVATGKSAWLRCDGTNIVRLGGDF